jgi:RING finger protein 113A
LQKIRTDLVNTINAQSARVNELSEAKESGGHVVYRGKAAYTSFVKKDVTEAVAKAKVMGTLGPGRAPSNVRGIVRVDYQPAICKDYKETGTCSFGDSCVFLHDRSEHKSSYIQDLEWQAKQKRKKERQAAKQAARLAAGGEGGEDMNEIDGDDDEEDDDDDVEIPGFKRSTAKTGSGTWADAIIGIDRRKFHHVRNTGEGGGGEGLPPPAISTSSSSKDALPPHACFICRNAFINPIQTQCDHYFCEKCASDRHRTNPLCAVCGKPTYGIFNQAKSIVQLLALRSQREKEGKEEEKNETQLGSWAVVN